MTLPLCLSQNQRYLSISLLSKKNIFGLVWIGILGLFVVKKFNLIDLQQAFSGLSFSFLWVSLGLDLLCLFVKSQAWRQLVFPMKELPINKAFAYYLTGAMLNQVLPLRGGDVGRSDLLRRNHDIPRLQGYSTVLVEGILNGLTLIPILMLAVLFFPIQKEISQKLVYFSAVVCALAIVAYVISKKFSYAWLEGFKVFQETKRFWFSFVFFLCAWIIYLASLTCMFRAFNMMVSFWAAPVLAVFLAASMVIPAPPGRIGVFEGTIVLALAMFGIKKETALGFGFVLHAAQSLPILLWGTVAWWFSQKRLLK